jgi:site-specific recombinase XerD
MLQAFFVEHLLQHKHVSPQTIASYRDTFRLLLQYAHKKLKTEPAALKVTALEAPVILSFLDSLEQKSKLGTTALDHATSDSPPSGPSFAG